MSTSLRNETSSPAKILTPIPLEQWQVSGHYFEHNGHKIFYRCSPSLNHDSPATSDQPVLLLIHGFPTSSWDWHRLWEALSKDYQLIAADMLGFGFSDKPQTAHYRIKDQADIQEALLDYLGVSSFDILAHDYGDTVTQELLARDHHTQEQKIKSVALLNGGLFPETHKPLLVQKLLLSPIGFIVSRAMSEKKLNASFAAICKQPLASFELHGFWQQVRYNHGHKVFHKLIHYMEERRIHRERWVSALQKCSVPMALINGSADPISGAHMVARYRALISQQNIYEIEDAGHYPQLETPESVLLAYQTFRKNEP